MGDFSRSRLIPIDPFTRQPFPDLPDSAEPPESDRPGDRGVFIRCRTVHAADRTSSPHRRSGIATTTSTRAWTMRWRLRRNCRSATASATENFSSHSRGRAGRRTGIRRHVAPPGAECDGSARRTFSRPPCSTNSAPASTACPWACSSRISDAAPTARSGLPELSSNARDFGLTAISVTGFSPLGDEGNNPQHGTTNIYQLHRHADLGPRPAPGEVRLRLAHPAAERFPRRGVARVHLSSWESPAMLWRSCCRACPRTPASRGWTIRSICAATAITSS